MDHKSKKTVHVHPAPPNALIQEIPTPDIVHSFETPPSANVVEDTVHAIPEQGRGSILSDVLGSYTGMTVDGERPEQDADDL